MCEISISKLYALNSFRMLFAISEKVHSQQWRRLAVQDHQRELKDVMDEYDQLGPEVRKALGDVASAFVAAGVGSGIVVLQAATGGSLE